MSVKVVQVVIGGAEFIGETDEAQYKSNGARFLQLNQACRIRYQRGQKGELHLLMDKLDNNTNYLDSVEILLDVKESTVPFFMFTLDPRGDLYRKYKQLVSGLVLPKVHMMPGRA
jgi:hypothetical protein